MTVRTAGGTWVVPPQRAVWIPACVPHGIATSGAVSMRTLYLQPGLVRRFPGGCRVVNVSPLLRGLVLHACTLPAQEPAVRLHASLLDLLVDRLEAMPAIPLQLPALADRRAARVAADAGCSTPSAFVAMCRRAFGTTPGRYVGTTHERPRDADGGLEPLES